MTSEQTTPPCMIVTGMPGAGKSTVTQLAAELIPRSARMDGDVANRLVVNGRVWALGEPADEAARQVDLCNRNLCSLAANFADAGFTPLIDWIIPEQQFFFDGYDDLEAAMKRELGDAGWWFDTSGLTPQQTAARVVAEAGQRALVTPRG
ncbi:energy-coupling factor transporter ATP-binding protein EcfA2 [Catenulispora sp. GP43]|uniref:phosphotransferase n=1 Tax=Catenulispora sp. GP43 TaxID=3156263 RepID=UPI00351616CC